MVNKGCTCVGLKCPWLVVAMLTKVRHLLVLKVRKMWIRIGELMLLGRMLLQSIGRLLWPILKILLFWTMLMIVLLLRLTPIMIWMLKRTSVRGRGGLEISSV